MINPNPRNTVRGRPRTTDGTKTCDRCSRKVTKLVARFPEGHLCGICYQTAVRTRGTCAGCRQDRLLPGLDDAGAPICVDCAGIDRDFHCTGCGTEAEPYRARRCSRCVVRADLSAVLLHRDGRDPGLDRLVDSLCAADRIESIYTWSRGTAAKTLLGQLGDGEVALTHDGLDTLPRGRHVEHIRSLLTHHKVLPARDHYLALFERWLRDKLDNITEPAIRKPIDQFARWHHLPRIRARAAAGEPTRGPVHSTKQEITETTKFLTWLHQTHDRTIATCTQADIDTYLAAGPTTRYAIRTFFVWAARSRITSQFTINHRQARTVPRLTQAQLLAWLRECLTGTSESLPYRVAATLLLLYAQPLVKVAMLRTSGIELTPEGTQITLGRAPATVPEPFASLLHEHLAQRPNLRTGSSRADSPWLFPGYRAGTHIHPNTIMDRLRVLGVSLLGARNAALRDLVTEVPPPIVATMLGYSAQVTLRHATAAAAPFSRYAALVQPREDGDDDG